MKKIYHNISYTALYTGIYLISLLPMKLLYRLSNIVYMLLLHVFAYRKAVVIQNLSRSFPDMNYKAIDSTMKAFYRSFADNVIEILKSASISYMQRSRQLELVNFDKITEEIAQHKNVIASLGHCGNWEILSVLPRLLQVNSYAVYQPLRSKVINRLCQTLRSRFGLKLIPTKSVVRHFLSRKDHPSLYFFLADQCPTHVDVNYRFRFLHQHTSTFSGMERLAKATGASVVYIHVLKTGRGMYRAECKTVCTNPEAKPTEVTKSYMHLLERNIQEQPSGWLWTHKRWKR